MKIAIAAAGLALAFGAGTAVAQQASTPAATPATPAQPATPATPADPAAGTSATPATPATPADPATPPATSANRDPLAPDSAPQPADKKHKTPKSKH